MEKRIQRYFVDTSPKQLRSHFDVDARIASDRPDAWLLTMRPKRKQIREGLSQLELWIRQDSVMLSAMRMIFPSGDSKLLEFEDVRINPTIDESAFLRERTSGRRASSRQQTRLGRPGRTRGDSGSDRASSACGATPAGETERSMDRLRASIATRSSGL